jgi:hypothetical protein
MSLSEIDEMGADDYTELARYAGSRGLPHRNVELLLATLCAFTYNAHLCPKGTAPKTPSDFLRGAD